VKKKKKKKKKGVGPVLLKRKKIRERRGEVIFGNGLYGGIDRVKKRRTIGGVHDWIIKSAGGEVAIISAGGLYPKADRKVPEKKFRHRSEGGGGRIVLLRNNRHPRRAKEGPSFLTNDSLDFGRRRTLQ